MGRKKFPMQKRFHSAMQRFLNTASQASPNPFGQRFLSLRWVLKYVHSYGWATTESWPQRGREADRESRLQHTESGIYHLQLLLVELKGFNDAFFSPSFLFDMSSVIGNNETSSGRIFNIKIAQFILLLEVALSTLWASWIWYWRVYKDFLTLSEGKIEPLQYSCKRMSEKRCFIVKEQFSQISENNICCLALYVSGFSSLWETSSLSALFKLNNTFLF